MEGNWTISVDGANHEVRAHVPTISFRPQLTVHLDGDLIHKQFVYLFLGEICCIRALDHELSLRVEGYGTLGKLKLLIDGVEAGASHPVISQRPVHGEPPTTEVVETRRVEEPLGDEVREIDNSRSSSPIARKLFVSREWTQTYSIENQDTEKIGGSLGVQSAGIIDLKATAETALQKRYQLSFNEKRVHSEELTLNISPHTKVRVVLRWKQAWQCGLVLVTDPRSEEQARVSFKVSQGLTFDLEQVES